MRRTAALLVLICISSPLLAATVAEPDQLAILVTGTSTGIGRKITERLAAEGYIVYAGARKDSDLAALAAIKNVRPVRLDVTQPQDIEAAVSLVTAEGHGLYALVNNAGIGSAAPILESRFEELEATMAVNVYGPYRMVQAFAPLILASKGRIINIGSIRGIISEAGVGIYQMSKHATESFSDVLAAELAPAGVQVCLVEPGSYHSEIGWNALRRTGAGAADADRSTLTEPDEVAAAVDHALFDPRPKRRYLVVPKQSQAQWTVQAQLRQLVQLNEGQRYTYDRRELIRLLDQALAHSRPRTAPAP